MTRCTACGWAGTRADGKDWTFCPSCGNQQLNIGTPLADRAGTLRLLDAISSSAAHDEAAGATWATIEAQAIEDPLLYRVIMHAESYGREAALVQAVVFLAAERRRRVQDEIERLRRSPAPPAIVRGDWGG